VILLEVSTTCFGHCSVGHHQVEDKLSEKNSTIQLVQYISKVEECGGTRSRFTVVRENVFRWQPSRGDMELCAVMATLYRAAVGVSTVGWWVEDVSEFAMLVGGVGSVGVIGLVR
jgi:hypothetical protein